MHKFTSPRDIMKHIGNSKVLWTNKKTQHFHKRTLTYVPSMANITLIPPERQLVDNSSWWATSISSQSVLPNKFQLNLILFYRKRTTYISKRFKFWNYSKRIAMPHERNNLFRNVTQKRLVQTSEFKIGFWNVLKTVSVWT